MTPDELLEALDHFGDAYAAARVEETDASDAREVDAKRPIVEAFRRLEVELDGMLAKYDKLWNSCAFVEGERDEARAELARYAEELEGLREVVSQHEAVVDTDAYRLAAGITCRPGQDHSCGDAHHIGRCYKPSAEPSGTEAG